MFAIGLICTLAGAIAGILFTSRFIKEREAAEFERGRLFEKNAQAMKDSDRAKKAAQTRRSKANAS